MAENGKVMVALGEELRAKVKIAAIQKGKKMRDYLIELIREGLKSQSENKRGK
jgi:hypothetical protein